MSVGKTKVKGGQKKASIRSVPTRSKTRSTVRFCLDTQALDNDMVNSLTVGKSKLTGNDTAADDPETGK